MSDAASIVVANATIQGFENLFLNAIREKLGADRDALKAFQIIEFKPETAEQAAILAKIDKQLFRVTGALGLNDSGANWKVFQVDIEQGLTNKDDLEVADQLAHQCLIAVAKMKRERKHEVHVIA